MGTALVAFLLLSADLGAASGGFGASSGGFGAQSSRLSSQSGGLGGQASGVTDSGTGELPVMLGQLGIQLSATSETRAGVAPLVPGDDPRRFVAEILTPLLGLELRRPGYTFQLFYGPRFLWEYPNPDSAVARQPLARDPVTRIQGLSTSALSGSQPLILHSAGLTLQANPYHPLFVVATATGSVGSPDYTELPQVLGTVQGSLPPIISLASGSALASVRLAATERLELTLTGQVFHWHWLDIPPGLAPAAVTAQTSVTADPEVLYHLTNRDRLGFDSAVTEAYYSNGAKVLTVTPEAIWRTRLTPRQEMRLTLGVTYVDAQVLPAALMSTFGSSGSALSPVGSVELDSHLFTQGQLTVLSTVGGGIDLFVDPILGTVVRRGAVGGGLTAISIPEWMILLRGDFATALRTTPFYTDPTAIDPDETVFSLTLSGRRRVSENFFAELGGRWADRAPAFVSHDFGFHQRQLWIYLSLTGTTRPIARPRSH